METITYKQAQEARDILVKYLVEKISYQDVIDYKNNRNSTECLALLALTQDYFLA